MPPLSRLLFGTTLYRSKDQKEVKRKFAFFFPFHYTLTFFVYTYLPILSLLIYRAICCSTPVYSVPQHIQLSTGQREFARGVTEKTDMASPPSHVFV